MLVLSRKEDESIIIGRGEIVIKVIKITGDKVRLGIEAPREIPVNRQEVFDDLPETGDADEEE